MGFFNFFERNKAIYYIKNGVLDIIPRFFFQRKLKHWILLEKQYSEKLLSKRLNYYHNNLEKKSIPSNLTSLKKITRKNNISMYYYDFMKIGRYFNTDFKVNYAFGDIDTNQENLTIVKSRPIHNNGNSVLLPLDKLRHFNFIEDTISFKDKKDEIVWRGVIHKENRKLLVKKFTNKKRFNVLAIQNKNKKKTGFLSIKEQLKYKFILSIEGIDVATNLKWIMSSNSLCFMPKPRFETWYMEGELIPNFHYVLIEDDYSDVEEKMNFYSENTDKAEEILINAKRWTDQFKDKKLEKLVSILVMNSYFKRTKQL
ncbi:MAG: Uncharacterised protein [Polaribacter sejongensis]|nr:MAG: Uncharacterised protein [Polaribacter sejongensis]|tara:strand:+ start:3223 stop:4161 length:939 start_codon:yes stop_codon:yes gene_type:complete